MDDYDCQDYESIHISVLVRLMSVITQNRTIGTV